jgi:RNase H-like domain found in reverse transcriptase
MADNPGSLGVILTQANKEGNFYAISFASRQLKDQEKNYSPFLLEAAVAVWGMDFFNGYLKGKCFILYTDHKPLEKLGHLHSKMLNRLQMALLEHDFVIQYKKGSNMPMDYLSRLPGVKDTVTSISAFNPFQADLYDLYTSSDTKATAFDVNNAKNPPKNEHLWHNFPFRNIKISGFTLTSLAQ